MKVTFDSNVWELVVAPEKSIADADTISFDKIRQAIIAKQITPFISATIFSLEGIARKNRKELFGKYTATVKSAETTDGNAIQVKLSIGPNLDAHPGNNAYLAKYLDLALALGFQVINVPRFASIFSPTVQGLLPEQTAEEFDAYTTRTSEAVKFIEALGCGMKPLLQVLSPYPRPYRSSMYRWIAEVPDSASKHIAKAIAEWADGDSVAAHIAMGNDYFCTRDQARGAGQGSILSSVNLAHLEQKYGFKTISPVELSSLC